MNYLIGLAFAIVVIPIMGALFFTRLSVRVYSRAANGETSAGYRSALPNPLALLRSSWPPQMNLAAELKLGFTLTVAFLILFLAGSQIWDLWRNVLTGAVPTVTALLDIFQHTIVAVFAAAVVDALAHLVYRRSHSSEERPSERPRERNL